MINAKKILLVRTDRIGELLLTSPAMRAIRQSFPDAEITIIVSSHSAGVVEGCPYVDSIIKFDIERIKSSFVGKLKIFIMVKKSRFDLAIMFNPSKFFNILTFLAGIPIRVGYDRKFGFLLSHRTKDRKYLCEKHEVEYNLDLVGLVGASTQDKAPYFPLDNSLEETIRSIFENYGIGPKDMLVAVHPATSNPEKVWPLDRIAKISDTIMDEFKTRIILIGGKGETKIADEVKTKIENSVLNLTGQLSIKELGSILKRCLLLISNDSGPVHIASAVGTSTVVFFGEERPGGSSKRWGPYGEGHSVISKPNVADITVEDAYKVIREKLSRLCRRD